MHLQIDIFRQTHLDMHIIQAHVSINTFYKTYIQILTLRQTQLGRHIYIDTVRQTYSDRHIQIETFRQTHLDRHMTMVLCHNTIVMFYVISSFYLLLILYTAVFSRIHNPEFRTRNSESRYQNPRIQNHFPESRIQDPESRTQ